MKKLKPIGFIVEQKHVFHLGKDKEHHEWVYFSKKIYSTIEIAEDAYQQSPYKNCEGYNVAGRIIPVYQKENEIINIKLAL